jgi:ABC-2 type transport system permease protein
MNVDAARPPAAAPVPMVPFRRRLGGIGSVYGKTLRDSRTGALLVGGLLGLLLLAGGGAAASEYGTPEARRELAMLSATMPPVMRGMYGNPVNVDTLGGFVTWHYGSYIALLAGLWSILALSSTLAGEGRRGSLDFVVTAPLARARIAAEKLAGHVTALAAASACIALGAWAAGAFFAVFPGDEVSPAAAAGFGVGIAARALMAGAVAFAIASFTGRGTAAGIAGALLFGGYVVTSYRAVVPAFDAVAGVSWYRWTADHLPLAGRWDWASLGLTAAATVILLAAGVVGFVRRDIGITGGGRTPGLPRAMLGVGGPVRRSLGEVLPASVAWGVGLGTYGLLMAAASRAFVDELARFPAFAEIVNAMLPGVDWSTPVGFLEVLFVDFGLVLVALAAATLVAGRMGDESSGRLELLLVTPLTRARYAIANGIGAWLGIVVVTACIAAALAVGVSAAGGDVATPLAGTLVLAAYGAAMVGIGFAVGGVVGPSRAGWAVVAFALATFVVDILGPILLLPDWLQQLALTNHLGQPMLGAWDVPGMAACLALAVGGLALGAWGLRRRDVAG